MPHSPFVGHLKGAGYADRTIGEYLKIIVRADRWLQDHRDVTLTAATAAQVRDFADTLPYTWATRKQARSALRHWQTWAQHPEDLAAAVRVPRKPKMRPRALDDSQAARLELEAHQQGRRGLAVLLGFYLGMRRTEIAAATWTSWDRGSGEWVWQRVKTGDLARLPVHPRLEHALDRAERAGPWLFPGNGGRRHVAPVTVWEWTKAVGQSCGVDVTTHQLRHTSISRVVEVMGLRVGQEFAGHRDPEVTAGYSLVSSRALAEAVMALSPVTSSLREAS